MVITLATTENIYRVIYQQIKLVVLNWHNNHQMTNAKNLYYSKSQINIPQIVQGSVFHTCSSRRTNRSMPLFCFYAGIAQ
jgi:hypothetical protein